VKFGPTVDRSYIINLPSLVTGLWFCEQLNIRMLPLLEKSSSTLTCAAAHAMISERERERERNQFLRISHRLRSSPYHPKMYQLALCQPRDGDVDESRQWRPGFQIIYFCGWALYSPYIRWLCVIYAKSFTSTRALASGHCVMHSTVHAVLL